MLIRLTLDVLSLSSAVGFLLSLGFAMIFAHSFFLYISCVQNKAAFIR